MEYEKMSLNKCKCILQKDGSIYKDEDIIEIRDFLYRLAEMDYEVFLKLKKKEKVLKEKKP